MTESNKEIKSLLNKLVLEKNKEEIKSKQELMNSFERLENMEKQKAMAKEKILKDQVYSNRFSED